jgi:hypothetical protein
MAGRLAGDYAWNPNLESLQTMKHLLSAALAATVLALGATQSLADWLDWMDMQQEAIRAIHDQWDRQSAKCDMETDQYFDEHPFTSFDTKDEMGERMMKRYRLCMNAAGFKFRDQYVDNVAFLMDEYRREREWLLAHGLSKDGLASFDANIASILDRVSKEEEAR